MAFCLISSSFLRDYRSKSVSYDPPAEQASQSGLYANSFYIEVSTKEVLTGSTSSLVATVPKIQRFNPMCVFSSY